MTFFLLGILFVIVAIIIFKSNIYILCNSNPMPVCKCEYEHHYIADDSWLIGQKCV